MGDITAKHVIAALVGIAAILLISNSWKANEKEVEKQRVERIERYSQPRLEKQLDGTKVFTVRSGNTLIVHYFEPFDGQDIKLMSLKQQENWADVQEVITSETVESNELGPEDRVSLTMLKLQHSNYIDFNSNH